MGETKQMCSGEALEAGMVRSFRSFSGLGANRPAGKRGDLPANDDFFSSRGQVLCPDGRREVGEPELSRLPYCAICMLVSHFPNGKTIPGTGWFIHSRVVVTAGHCILLNKNKWATSVELFLPHISQQVPIATFTTDRNGANPNNAIAPDQADYGAIVLDKNPSVPMGRIEYRALSDAQLESAEATIAGYLDTFPVERCMEQSAGGVMCCETKKLSLAKTPAKDGIYHEIDTDPGQSGSPIWLARDSVAIGIHTGHPQNDYKTNWGVRITEPIARELTALVSAAETNAAAQWIRGYWSNAGQS